MDYKTYRKYSSTLVASEFRSYGRNKMEDRKLAIHNDGVNKNIERRRKSFVNEKDLVNKHFQEKVSKTTPSVEQYLQRSHTKYNAWKQREQERLDRRYRGLYKSYLKEYSDLKLDESIAGLTGIRKLSTASDTDVQPKKVNNEPTEPELVAPVIAISGEAEANTDKTDGAENPIDISENNDEVLDTVLSLEQMSLQRKPLKTSSVSETLDKPISIENSRRFSTGGILFQAEKKVNVGNMPKYSDVDMNKCGASPAIQENPVGGNETVPEESTTKGDKSRDTNASSVVKKKKRSSSLQKSSGLQIPLGTRLDRRSSLANVDIAVKYGN